VPSPFSHYQITLCVLCMTRMFHAHRPSMRNIFCLSTILLTLAIIAVCVMAFKIYSIKNPSSTTETSWPNTITTTPSTGLYLDSSLVTEIKDASTYSKLKLISSPKMVVYYATWCPHCVHFRPTFEDLSKSTAGSVSFYAVNCVDSAVKMICDDEGVEAYPTIIAFQFPKPAADRIKMSAGKDTIQEFLTKNKAISTSTTITTNQKASISLLSSQVQQLNSIPVPYHLAARLATNEDRFVHSPVFTYFISTQLCKPSRALCLRFAFACIHFAVPLKVLCIRLAFACIISLLP
jgi:thiol-disulfide isomerase/thioredoxin